jgi:hypothetical protein
MNWKVAILLLLPIGFCLGIGKFFAVWFNVWSNGSHLSYHLNWVAAGLWWYALYSFAMASIEYEAASQKYLDSKSGRYKPHTSKPLLARFARWSVAISALIFLAGILIQMYL